jgi:phosphosulfolactate synthase
LLVSTSKEVRPAWEYLKSIGVPELGPRTSPFDPGYDPVTLEAHLDQSHHLISSLKISMACWQIAQPEATLRKIRAARKHRLVVCTGGGPFEVAAHFGRLEAYLDLCATLGFTRVEAGEGFTETLLDAGTVIRMAATRGLQVQFEVGKKHTGTFGTDEVGELIDQGRRWLDAGAVQIVVEARESAANVGVFGAKGEFDAGAADRFAAAFGLDIAVFEAPNKPSQFAMLNHFGPQVHLANVRIEELLRVEIYRRGLHSDAFQQPNLRPRGPGSS